MFHVPSKTSLVSMNMFVLSYLELQVGGVYQDSDEVR